MTTSVTAATVYVVKCGACGWKETSDMNATARRLADEHDEMHTSSRAIAPVIAARVFVHDAPNLEWFGTFWKAANHARMNGFAYLTWNGWVYDAVLADLSQRVCLAQDLPHAEVPS